MCASGTPRRKTTVNWFVSLSLRSAKCQIQHICDERQRHSVHQAPVARNAILAATGPVAVVAPGSMGAALEHVELVPPREYILATTKIRPGLKQVKRVNINDHFALARTG